MNRDWMKYVLDGKLRRNSVAFHQYTRWISKKKHLGVEVEIPTEAMRYEWYDESMEGFPLYFAMKSRKFKTPEGYSRKTKKYMTLRSHCMEVQKLFSLDCPIKFREQVKNFWDELQEKKILFTASIHVSIQAKRCVSLPQIDEASLCVFIQKDLASRKDEKRGNVRLEFKTGPSSLTFTEFFGKLLLCASFNYCSKRYNFIVNSSMGQSVPRVKKLAKILDEIGVPLMWSGSYTQYVNTYLSDEDLRGEVFPYTHF